MSEHRPLLKTPNRSKNAAGDARPRAVVRQAAWYACEKLESRRLLTTFTGGGVINGVPQENVETYLDANNDTIKVALWGTITAEFIFVRVDGATNNTTISDAVAPTTANITADAGADLFSIYVASASPTASISIAQEDTATNSGNPEEGFAASGINSITVNNAETGMPLIVAPTAASGSVYIGARAYLKPAVGLKGPPTNGTPITSVPLTTQIGVRPVTEDQTLYAGLQTAPGVSLNRVLIGGQITGRVDLGGSIDTFYAGDIWTGDAAGIQVGFQPGGALARNFNVAGDLNDLITLGPIGTDAVLLTGKPAYETGFRLSVGGHIGQVKSENSIDGSFYAENLSTLKGLGRAQTEQEIVGLAPPAKSGLTFFEGNATSADGTSGVPSLGDNEATFNDNTPANAQFLGTPFSSAVGHNSIQLLGTLDNESGVGDNTDVYGVALGADQTIVATLKSNIEFAGEIDLGILAPDAGIAASTTALLASTYDARNALRLEDQPITFTSTDAGVYYFAVGYETDTNFTGNSGLTFAAVNYELDVTGVKNVGIGAITAVGNIDFASGEAANSIGVETSQPSVQVDSGDLGAIITTGAAGSILAGDFGGGTNPITVKNGGIRVIQGASIASEVGNLVAFAPDIRASGNVGVIRTTLAEPAGGGGNAIMALNLDIDAPNTGTPIGGSYQLVDCAGLFAASLVANGSIGTIRAEDIGLIDFAPVLQVNFSNSKTVPGIIDLIDVTGRPNADNAGHFGTLSAGGPRIITGPSGNVRYIHIAPAVEIFNDQFFGGLEDEPITYAAATAASLIDDSGTPFTITPYRGQANISGDASAPATTTGTTTTTDLTSTITGDTLTLETYGIEDKGGVVVISVTAAAGDIDVSTASTSGTTTTGTVTTHAGVGPTSISVDTSAAGAKGSVDFGSIDLVGPGSQINFDPTTRAFTTTNSTGDDVPEDDSATFSGKNPIGVYNLAVTQSAIIADVIPALTGATNIINNTSGEIVNFEAQGVETLKAASLGTAKSDVGAPVSGATVLVDEFPFHQQRSLIQIGGRLVAPGTPTDPTAISGDAVGAAETIESTGPLGDILTNGTLGNVLPDIGGAVAKGVAEGIDGPVYAASPEEYSTPAHSTLSGNILNINIGQGLGTSGSGNYAITGIFADNYIGSVTNQNGSDIRGSIAAQGSSGGLPAAVVISPITGLPIVSKTTQGLYINNITLTGGGSIIDSNILTSSSIIQTLNTTGAFLITNPNGNTNGNPADAAYAIGSINITGNGGIIGSIFIAGGINSISVKGGFGIFTSLIESLNSDVVGSINADGYGIRSSEIVGQNSVGSIAATGTGKELSVTRFSKSVRQSENGSDVDVYSGQPLDVYDDLDEFLGTSAKKSTRKGSTEAGVIADTTITGTFNLGSVTAFRIVGHPVPVATTIAQILAQDNAPTPAMSIDFANSIGKISVAENTTDLNVTTGTLNTFESGDNVVATKFNVAGEIKKITAGFFNGSTYINANGPDGIIDYISTTGGLNANVDASVGIGEMLVGTDLASTNVTSGGNLDELYVKGSILKGSNVFVAKTLANLTVRHNFLGGSTIQARAITKKTVGGISNGNFIIVPPSP